MIWTPGWRPRQEQISMHLFFASPKVHPDLQPASFCDGGRQMRHLWIRLTGPLHSPPGLHLHNVLSLTPSCSRAPDLIGLWIFLCPSLFHLQLLCLKRKGLKLCDELGFRVLTPSVCLFLACRPSLFAWILLESEVPWPSSCSCPSAPWPPWMASAAAVAMQGAPLPPDAVHAAAR